MQKSLEDSPPELADAEAILRTLAGLYQSHTSQQNAPEKDDSSAEMRYRILLEQIPAVVFMAYVDGGIGDAYVSPHVETLLGFTQNEWLEEPIRFYRQIHPEDKTRWSIEAAALFLTGQPLRSVYRVIAKDGKVVWFQCEAKMVRRADGRPWFIHGVGFDITALKRTEVSLEEALAKAEEASRAKSEFLTNMSHEIRTPINGIMGMAEIALSTKLDAEQRDCIQVIQNSANALLAIVNDILDFSKIQARRLRLCVIEFSLRRCVEDTLKLFALPARQKGLALESHIAEHLPDRLLGDPDRLWQVLVNLVSNAIKFTEKGSVALRVEIESSTNENVLLHFQVTDTGIGIPFDKQALIFDAFSQGDTSSTRKYGGTGLGLAISSALVALMGGSIWLESEPNRGTTFHFTAHFARPAHSVEPMESPVFAQSLS